MFKVCVYAISKNEEKFAKRWADCVSSADGVYVLDTGSTDDTVKILQSCNVNVKVKEIKPWRFDKARNESLKLVPKDADICVCCDLDEVFEKGWREVLEKSWSKQTDLAKYRYTWSFNSDKSEGCVFWIAKIHARNNFVWQYPVHEVLKFTEKRKVKSVFVNGLQLNHYADLTKSRGNYLPLLELAVKENPKDDRNMHYLGREYMYRQKWDRCIKTLKAHLKLDSAVWEDERAASMRYIAKSYGQLNDIKNAYKWHFKSIATAPHLREPYCDFASLLFKTGDYYGTIFMCDCALKIKERSLSYINEADSWGFLPYDLSAIAYYHLGEIDKAVEFSQKAISCLPNDKRLIENHNLYQKKLISR